MEVYLLYDIIGDIHGEYQTLKALLSKLDYVERDGIYRHPNRTAIFIGDFVDRGPRQREVVDLARRMVDAGTAQSVMGNHEYNAIAYATPDPAGGYLRAHSEKNKRQHSAFLNAYEYSSEDYADTIAWFKTLPLWLDLGDLRVIHACWDELLIKRILARQEGSTYLSDDLLARSCQRDRWEYDAIETLLKGKELRLPNGNSFHDKEGTERHYIRIRWWDREATTYQKAFLGPESARTTIPDDEILGDHLIYYSRQAPPVFLGHYWMDDDPAPLASNIACLDYSVARPGGRLVAYRWDGESTLVDKKFLYVDRVG